MLNLLAAGTASARGRGRACSAAADEVRERLVEIDTAIAHVTNLLGLGECVRNITRLAGGACLQDKRRCARKHRRTEGGTPSCRIVAARICGDDAFSWSGKGDHAGAVV